LNRKSAYPAIISCLHINRGNMLCILGRLRCDTVSFGRYIYQQFIFMEVLQTDAAAFSERLRAICRISLRHFL
jgi:hypothetical protein